MPTRSAALRKTAARPERELRDAGGTPLPLQARLNFSSAGGLCGSERSVLADLLKTIHPAPTAEETATHLLDVFGNLDTVFHASPHELSAIRGVCSKTLCLLTLQARLLPRIASIVHRRPLIFSSIAQVQEYLLPTMGELVVETVRCLFLDTKNQLLADEEMGRGTVNHVPLYVREVVKRALLRRATSVILTHNHPSGDPTASEADVAMTTQVQLALSHIDVKLHDHIIIARNGYFSFRGAGYFR